MERLPKLPVDFAVSVHSLVGHPSSQVSPGVDPLEAAELPEVVVVRHSVFPRPLHVDGGQVHSELLVGLLEKMICNLEKHDEQINSRSEKVRKIYTVV